VRSSKELALVIKLEARDHNDAQKAAQLISSIVRISSLKELGILLKVSHEGSMLIIEVTANNKDAIDKIPDLIDLMTEIVGPLFRRVR